MQQKWSIRTSVDGFHKGHCCQAKKQNSNGCDTLISHSQGGFHQRKFHPAERFRGELTLHRTENFQKAHKMSL